MTLRRCLILLALPLLARSLGKPAAEDLLATGTDEVEALLGSRENDTMEIMRKGIRPARSLGKPAAEDMMTIEADEVETLLGSRENDTMETMRRKGIIPTADYYLRYWHNAQEQSATCLPELGGVETFSEPDNPLHRQIAPGGRVFLVGDSVVGQICQLGSPGLCCSSARPCTGPPPFPGSATSPQEIQLDLLPEYKGQGWQHLFQFRLRNGTRAAETTAYFVAPEVHDEIPTVDRSVSLVTAFLEERGTTADDVLVLGMIGTHYNHGLSVFQEFVTGLITRVVNRFPGRVVLLGYAPQHFAGAGHFNHGVKACAPSPLPSDIDIPRNSFRSAIFLRSVWAHLAHGWSKLVDFNVMLSPLWNCHRTAGDCTHWKDPVITFQGQLILDALQKIV